MEGYRQPFEEINRGKAKKNLPMEGRRQPLAELNRGNNVAHKTQKQSNKHKPLSTLGAPIPIGKENLKAGADSGLVAKSNVKSKPVKTNVKWGPNPNYKITEEDEQMAEIWAREGIEKRFGLSGRDMEKMEKEDEKRRMDLSYRFEARIPDWLHLVGNHLGAPVEPPEIEDHFELLLEEDTSIVFPEKTLRMEEQYIDHDELFCDEYLEKINSPRLAVIGECGWETVM